MIAEATQPSPTPVRSKAIVIRKVAVLGAGTMGSRIAAHMANAGIPVVLLDIVPENASSENRTARNAVVASALESLKKAKPAAFYDPGAARLITIGNFEDDLKLLAHCDWIIE